jgi:hypothetical protein
MATAITGLVAGIVGALAMVPVMRMVGADADPPFAVFWATFVGDGDPEAAMPAALSLHLVYGAVAGAVLVVVALAVGGPGLLNVESAVGGLAWGVVWAVVLMVGAMVQANTILDMDPDQDAMLSMGLAHLAYGVVVGLLVAFLPV